MTRVQHIATFYKAFSLVPKGRHEIHVCMGTACHVRGADRVLDSVQDLTGIMPGETDLDLKFSLETVNCLGCCALGPVMEVDGRPHGKIDAGRHRGRAEELRLRTNDAPDRITRRSWRNSGATSCPRGTRRGPASRSARGPRATLLGARRSPPRLEEELAGAGA